MPLSDEDVREILRLIDESDVEELRVETGEFSGSTSVAAARPPRPSRGDAGAAGARRRRSSRRPRRRVTHRRAPMLGTFYRAQAPGAAPFVDVGTRVEPDTVVCLIEVMKMMNSVPAGVAGTIVEVCAENAQLVEHGAPLFQVGSDR